MVDMLKYGICGTKGYTNIHKQKRKHQSCWHLGNIQLYTTSSKMLSNLHTLKYAIRKFTWREYFSLVLSDFAWPTPDFATGHKTNSVVSPCLLNAIWNDDYINHALYGAALTLSVRTAISSWSQDKECIKRHLTEPFSALTLMPGWIRWPVQCNEKESK